MLSVKSSTLVIDRYIHFGLGKHTKQQIQFTDKFIYIYTFYIYTMIMHQAPMMT